MPIAIRSALRQVQPAGWGRLNHRMVPGQRYMKAVIALWRVPCLLSGDCRLPDLDRTVGQPSGQFGKMVEAAGEEPQSQGQRPKLDDQVMDFRFRHQRLNLVPA